MLLGTLTEDLNEMVYRFILTGELISLPAAFPQKQA